MTIEIGIDADIQRKSGLVVLLDSLGTQGILATQSFEEIVTRWRFVVEAFESAAATEVGQGFCDSCAVVSFSDTVLITMCGEPKRETVNALARVLFRPFFSALTNGVFFRGAISSGSFYQDNTKIIGPAIDEAAAWYEQANWIGITASPSFDLLLQRLRIQEPDVRLPFVQCQVEEKGLSARRTTHCFNWPHLATEMNADARLLFMRALESYCGVVPIHAAAKYTNTIAFFEQMTRLST